MEKVFKTRDEYGRFIKGHKPTPEMIEKDRFYHLGKKHTRITKLKISKSKKGQAAWNKGIPNPNIQGSNHPSWIGGKIFSKEGYVYIYSPNHPGKNERNYVLEHRLVMEKEIGRYLEKGEVVHHINHIKNDNHISNLKLMKSHSEHMEEHNNSRSRDMQGKYI